MDNNELLTQIAALLEDQTERIDKKMDQMKTELRAETKAQIDQLRSEVNIGMDQLRGEVNTGLNQLRGEVNSGMDQLRSEVNSGMDQLRGEVAAEMEQMRQEMHQFEVRLNIKIENSVTKKIDTLFDSTLANREKLEQIEERLDLVEGKIDTL